MIFGLFENKQGRAFREETANTIADADSLEKKDKHKIAKFVLLEIIIYMKEIESVPTKPSPELDEVVKRHGTRVMQMRREAMSELGSKDPDWLKYAILESFILGHAATRTYGKKICEDIMAMIIQWIQINAPEDYDKYENEIVKIH